MDPVALVGSGPATDAVALALEEESVPVERREDTDFADATLGVVTARVGSETFEVADDAARDADVPWVAIELGGVGGYPLVEASVAGLDPSGPCYRCLAGRVEANAPADAEPSPAPGGPTARLAGAIAGRELVDLLDPDRARPIDRSARSLLGRLIELPHAEREVLPLPGCDCGSDADQDLRRGGDSLDLDAALAQAERGLDSRVGVVAQVGEAESYPAPYYLAELCDTSGFSDATAPHQAAGVARGWNEAFMKALGESYERYAAGVYRADEFTRAALEYLDAYVPPNAFVSPAKSAWFGTDGGEPVRETDGGPAESVVIPEFVDESADVDEDAGADEDASADESDGSSVEDDDDATPTADDVYDWLPAENLATGEETYVPADLVVHPPRNTDIRPPITTGLGLGSSGADALLSGLYEVIERDATMLAWYSTYEPLGLAIEDEDYETLASRVRAEGLSITPLLVTQDVDVPVVAVAVHRDAYPRIAFGSAANLDPHRAAQSALAEAIQNWMELRTMGAEGAAEASGAIGQYASDPDPATEWLDPESTVTASTVGPDEPPTGEAAVDALVDRLDEAGMTAYGARTTTRDLEEMGFEGVRVLVPTAQPLFLGDAFFGERAETVPVAMGFEPRLDREHHPFP